jgi:exopolyphosphatase/guanosine-5'-triphosphate,3'-diphosphate pyrophosphatase
MARSKPIQGLDAHELTRHNLPQIFSVRIAELWAFARHLPYPERVHELHDMRIAAKRLRYCFEFFAPCLGPRLKQPLEQFKKLQDYLGEIHDSDVWMDYLRGELSRAFAGLERKRRKLQPHVGADYALGRKAEDLAAELSEGPAVGLLRMINEVVERRSRLYGELVAFWGEVERRDLRGELLRIVAESAGTRVAELPVGAKPASPSSRSRQAVSLGEEGFAPTAQVSTWPSGEIRAATDIGSNSVKTLILKRTRSGHEVVADLNQVTGLGRGLSASGLFDPDAVDATLEVITAQVQRARELGAASVVAGGTAAMRSAGNPEAILDPLREIGVAARVLSGEEEAEISRAVAMRELRGSRNAVLFDTGGGSTELSWFSAGSLKASVSLPLGARRLTELAKVEHPVNEATRKRLLRLIHGELERAPQLPARVRPVLAGLGGTASVIVWIMQGHRGEAKGDPHGEIIELSRLRGLQAALARKTRDELLAMPNLDPLRADIIYSGVAIIVKVLEHYGATQFKVVDRGLRWGLLLG